MPTLVGNVFPVAEEWLGIGPERNAPGVVAAPSATLPVEKIEPDEKVNYLFDQTLRGMMANLFSATPGTESAEADFGGPVYLDTIGHVMLNLFGDYAATGSSPTNATTLSTAAAVGATSVTVASGTGYAISQAVQIGTGATAEVVVLTNVASNTLTFAGNPLRFAHAFAQAVATVVAPFTHTFSLLNSSPGQPQTHTLTHYNGMSGANKANAYAYWCASSCGFNMDAEKLFTHETKGVAYIRQPAFLLQPPAAVTVTTAATGGTVLAGTYQVTITYTASSGETTGTVCTPIVTTGSTSTITIPSPAPVAGATGWYAYVSQLGGNTVTRQQTAGSPTAIGTPLTLTAPPTSSGLNPQTTNTSGPITNAFSNVPVYPNWRFAVGIGGPASGGTLVNDVALCSLDITRQVKPIWTANGQQAPYVIYRNALEVSGKYTEVAQSDNPMSLLLNNTQPQLQLVATNGLTGANLLAITFNMQVAAVQTVKLQNNELIEYETTFKALANPTNAGGSGGQSPISVVIQNAVPTY